MRNKSGFTLVELVIVISVIALLASIGIPYLLRVRVNSNETAAVGNLRTLSNGVESYRSAQNPPSYPENLDTLISATPPYLDSSWSNAEKQGYVYTYSVAANGATFSTVANPQVAGVSGINSYCIDQTGILRKYSSGAGSYGSDTGCDGAGSPV